MFFLAGRIWQNVCNLQLFILEIVKFQIGQIAVSHFQVESGLSEELDELDLLAGSGVLGLLSLTAASLSEGSFLQYFIAGQF